MSILESRAKHWKLRIQVSISQEYIVLILPEYIAY